jgi:hypothetical protein
MQKDKFIQIGIILEEKKFPHHYLLIELKTVH